MTFTAGNLFPSHSCIGVTRVKHLPGFEPRSPALEADDLPTDLSLPLLWLILLIYFSAQETNRKRLANIKKVTRTTEYVYSHLATYSLCPAKDTSMPTFKLQVYKVVGGERDPAKTTSNAKIHIFLNFSIIKRKSKPLLRHRISKIALG